MHSHWKWKIVWCSQWLTLYVHEFYMGLKYYFKGRLIHIFIITYITIELFIIWNTSHDNNKPFKLLQRCESITFYYKLWVHSVASCFKKKSVLQNLHITNNIKRYLIFANINLHFTTTNMITAPQHTPYHHNTYKYIWFTPRKNR